jgi:polyhydroxyalkanoate synthase
MIDERFKARLAQLTNGVSPAGMFGIYANRLAHLALSPGKRLELLQQAAAMPAKLANYTRSAALDPETALCVTPGAGDKRFSDEAWRSWPYNLLHQSFLMTQEWWRDATTDIDGLAPEDARAMSFHVRQGLDRFAPSNFPWTNPVVAAKAFEENGANFARGGRHLVEDMAHAMSGEPPAGAENFLAGRDVAVTPGQVVFRNHLIELIQYAPTTPRVRAEPILIVPAWIMKFYILDLSPHNSLVKYLVDNGHTVFMISWRNPDAGDRDLGIDDYLKLGIAAALAAVNAIAPDRKVHAVGYCLGGTLLAIAVAMAGRDDDRLASVSLLAAQTDFTEAGELMLFMRESEVAYLENLMRAEGYLSGRQMAGAFQMLRSNDLIWSRLVRDYMLGERAEMTDLMAWNADATRMPLRMHSEYLRKLYLNNDLATGRFMVDGRPVRLADIRAPIFAVGTERDHVAPWRSVYKINFCAATEVTFLLTTGGHNAGIVSEPGHQRRSYRLSTTCARDDYVDPAAWLANTASQQGSWWPAWQAWLAKHSRAGAEPPSLGAADLGYAPIWEAPGEYVLQK